MNAVKAIFCRIGHIFLSICRSLKKLVCCRRKRDNEYLLPMTIDHIVNMDENVTTGYESSQWDAWPEVENTATNVGNAEIGSENMPPGNEGENEDFFKDMVPQIRKAKKVLVRNENTEQEHMSSNRLAMDPKAILTDSDLGVIDDNPSSWEDPDLFEEPWDPDILIREKKRAEHEKRRAEHQRRKQERENKRTLKPESLSSMMMSLTDSKDKHKYS